MSEWRTMETAPKDGTHILVASFAPGSTVPRWTAQVSYGTAYPGLIQCAAYSGWFVEPPFVACPPVYKGGRAQHGILYESDCGPTHWMPLPEPPKGDAA